VIAQDVSYIFILEYRIDQDKNMPQIPLKLEVIHLWVSCYILSWITQRGHGTDACADEHCRLFLEQYNITIIQQVPQLYTNVLDLGVWARLQSAIEREYYMQRINQGDLVWSVLMICSKGHLDRMIEKVFERLSKVLRLINKGRGGNDLVETKCGVKNEDMKLNFDLNTQYFSWHVYEWIAMTT